MERLGCNTQLLKKLFFFEYESFLSQCDVVVSAPILFSWAGGFLVHFGGNSMIQKLPLRTYVGIRKNSEGIIRYQGYRAYAPYRGKFIDVPIENFLDSHGLTKLQLFLKNHFENVYDGVGYDIFILSENDWLDTCPIYVSLAICFLLSLGEISTEMIDKFSTHFELYKDSVEFDNYFKIIWKILLQVENMTTLPACGGEVANCVVTSKFPVLYMTEERLGGGNYDNITEYPHHIEYHQSLIVDQIEYKITVLDKYVADDFVWPIRFGIVYPGYRQMVEFRDWGKTMRKKIIEMKKFVEANTDIFQLKKQNGDLFLNTLTNSTPFLRAQLGASEYYSVQIIKSFMENILNKGEIKDFIIALKQFKDVFNVIYNMNPEYKNRSFEGKFLKNLERNAMENNSYFVQEKAIQGDMKLLYVVSKKSFPYFYEDFTSAEFYKEGVVSLDYDSHLDGIGTEGARLEMFREKKYFSEWLTNYAKHAWINNYVEKRLVYEKESLDTLPIMIHLPQERIYMKGKKLNTNDIISQSYTIQVLTKLMETPGGQLANNQIPLSAYSVSKNDFQHKIIRPFMTSVEKYVGTDHGIIFECEGTFTEFRITLEDTKHILWFLNEPNFQ